MVDTEDLTDEDYMQCGDCHHSPEWTCPACAMKGMDDLVTTSIVVMTIRWNFMPRKAVLSGDD